VIVDQISLFVNSTAAPVVIEVVPAIAPCTFGQRLRWTDSPFNRSFDFASTSNAAINGTPPPGTNSCASGINVDLRNGTAVTTLDGDAAAAVPADGVEFVYLGQHTPIWHYDGPFPNYEPIPGPDTTRVRWSGHTVPPGAVVHVGAAMQGHPQLLGILWLNGNDVVGCAGVLDAPGTHTNGGEVSFSGLPLCGGPTAMGNGATLYATDLRIEWHIAEVPLEDLLANVARNPLRTDVVPGVFAVPPGQSLDVGVPLAPDGARFMVLLYQVADVYPMEGVSTRMFSQVAITWGPPTATDTGEPLVGAAPGDARLWLSRSPGPNPARGRIEFAITAREPIDVDVTVIDVAGRPVARLHRGAIAAGEHRFAWQGLRATGERVPSGVYWLHMQSGATRVTRKFVLMQ
jgi:hypothetical protein